MRIVRVAAPAALIPLTALLLGAASLSAQQAPGTTWDFESGRLSGWTATGDAFRFQPIRGDNVQARGRGQTSNHVGEFWVGTFEDNRTRGGFQGDGPTGTLESGSFVVPQSISFLVGGGSSFATRVELIVGYEDAIEGSRVVMSASGADEETMRRQVWDVRRWSGQLGRIRIVDEGSGPWGHINVDDFRFVPDTDQPPRQAEITGILPLAPQQERRVPAPPLLGRTVPEAREMLAESALVLGQVSGRPALETPGTIIDQSPPPDAMVPPRSAINVTLSEWISVPELRRRSVDEARALVDRMALRLGGVGERESDQSPGTVIDQAPGAGSNVPPGTTVEIVVAVPRPVIVPSVIGQNLGGATDVLRQVNLTVGEVSREPSDGDIGTVIRQTPPPNTRGRPNGSVDVVLAQGVPVPDLTTMPWENAQRMLSRTRLTVGTISSEPSAQAIGSVIGQSIPGGREVPLGTPVDLVLAEGVQVPDLVGIAFTTARDSLFALELGTTPPVPEPSTNPPGTVLRQTPAPGVSVPLLETVELVVAQGVEVPELTAVTVEEAAPAQIPNVFALDSAAARRMVIDSGFVFETAARRRWSLEPSGVVLSQTPPAGAARPLGTPVEVVVARHIPVVPLTGGVLLAMVGIAGYVARKPRKQSGTDPAPPPSPPFRAEPRTGHIETTWASSRPTAAREVRWHPILDAGRRSMDGPGPSIEEETIMREPPVHAEPGSGGEEDDE